MPVDEALAAALGRIVAEHDRIGEQGRRVLLAECESVIARSNAAIATLEARADGALRSLADATARIRDGDPGPVGLPGEPGVEGPAGPPGPAGPAGEPGERGAPGDDGLPGPQGEPGRQGDAGPQGDAGAPGAAGVPGPQGDRGMPGDQGNVGPPGRDGEPGPQGERGAQGERGPTGFLTNVEAWPEGREKIAQSGEVYTYRGALWQCRDMTARDPDDDFEGPWIQLAAAGQNGRDGADAREGEVCGLFDEARTYGKFDIVSLDGGEYRAVKDNPGPCPGDGWRATALRGRKGDKGAQGERGPVGPVGRSGNDIESVTVHAAQFIIAMTNGDTHAVDLEPVVRGLMTKKLELLERRG